MGRYVRADHPAAGQKSFSDWQAKSFGSGRSDKRFTSRVAPLQLRFRQSLEEVNTTLQTATRHQPLNAVGFRPRDANDDQLCIGIELAKTRQASETSDQQRNVFVTAMLRNAEQEWFALPAGKGGRERTGRLSLNAVVDSHRLPRDEARRILSQTNTCYLRNAGDRIHISNAVLQDQAIKDELRKTKV
jgi:hypothetical protein